MERGYINLERAALSDESRSISTDPDSPLSHVNLERWRRKMQVRGLADTTISDYLRVVQGMLQYAGKADPLELDEDDVEIFIVARRRERAAIGKELSASRHNVYLAAVRACFRANKAGKSDPTADIDRLHRDSVQTPPATETQVRGLLGAAVEDMASTDATTADTGRRMWMLTRLMSGLGYRVSTATRSYASDLQFDGEQYWMYPQFIKARRGQPKPRHAVQADIVTEILLNWQPGESFAPLEWTPTRTTQRWLAWAESHGISGVRPHMLRSYFLNKLYERTGDLYGVSMAADHRDIKTTVGYFAGDPRKQTLEELRTFDDDMPARIPTQRRAEHDQDDRAAVIPMRRPSPA